MPNHDDLDIVSHEMADRLHAAGWTKVFRSTDWLMDGGKGPYQYGDMPMTYTRPKYLHLPRRRDLEKALEEMGVSPGTAKDHLAKDWVAWYKPTLDPSVLQRANTPADAIGEVWLEARRRQNENNAQ